jgi:hypothetical protein
VGKPLGFCFWEDLRGFQNRKKYMEEKNIQAFTLGCMIIIIATYISLQIFYSSVQNKPARITNLTKEKQFSLEKSPLTKPDEARICLVNTRLSMLHPYIPVIATRSSL